jgi:hypothetical protein
LKEKRRSKRIPEENEVTVMVDSKDTALPTKKTCYAMTKDISLRGLRVRCAAFFPVDACVKLEILFTRPSQFISVYGNVRWVKELTALGLFEIGLGFSDLSLQNSKILKERIKRVIE